MDIMRVANMMRMNNGHYENRVLGFYRMQTLRPGQWSFRDFTLHSTGFRSQWDSRRPWQRSTRRGGSKGQVVHITDCGHDSTIDVLDGTVTVGKFIVWLVFQ